MGTYLYLAIVKGKYPYEKSVIREQTNTNTSAEAGVDRIQDGPSYDRSQVDGS